MPAAIKPANEAKRLEALRSYRILDTEFDRRFDGITQLAARMVDAPIALISLVDADRQWFKSRVGLCVDQTARDQAFCAHAILENQPLIVPDATRDARFSDNALVTGDPNIRFYAGVPLIDQDGYALGTLCIIDHKPRTLSDDQQALLVGLSHSVVMALELHRAMHRMHDLAMTDSLTGLPNRAAFIDAADRVIARLRRQGRPFALICLDCDGFKRINDDHGHAAGDAMLRRVADTLRAVTRQEDVAARLGGDEFGLIVEDQIDGLASIAERIRSSVAAARTEAGHQVTASIGALHVRTPPPDIDTIMLLADRSLYDAKLAGRNRAVVSVYPPD